MDRNQLEVLLTEAVYQTLTEEIELLQKGLVERNFANQLTTRIESRVRAIYPEESGIRAEAHYNKLGDAPKQLEPGAKGGSEADIIIHKRGSTGPNIAVIEIETNNKPKLDDLHKLEKMTRPVGETGHFGYLFGVFIAFGIEQQAGEILVEKWYENGNEIQIGTPITHQLIEMEV